MKVHIEIDEETLKRLVMSHILALLGDLVVPEQSIVIEVKSKQNYKSEWEVAAYRATVKVET